MTIRLRIRRHQEEPSQPLGPAGVEPNHSLQEVIKSGTSCSSCISAAQRAFALAWRPVSIGSYLFPTGAQQAKQICSETLPRNVGFWRLMVADLTPPAYALLGEVELVVSRVGQVRTNFYFRCAIRLRLRAVGCAANSAQVPHGHWVPSSFAHHQPTRLAPPFLIRPFGPCFLSRRASPCPVVLPFTLGPVTALSEPQRSPDTDVTTCPIFTLCQFRVILLFPSHLLPSYQERHAYPGSKQPHQDLHSCQISGLCRGTQPRAVGRVAGASTQ